MYDIIILRIEDEFCPFDNTRKKYNTVFKLSSILPHMQYLEFLKYENEAIYDLIQNN